MICMRDPWMIHREFSATFVHSQKRFLLRLSALQPSLKVYEKRGTFCMERRVATRGSTTVRFWPLREGCDSTVSGALDWGRESK